MRYRPLLREAIRSDNNVKELSENQNSSSVRNYHAIVMSKLVGSLLVFRVARHRLTQLSMLNILSLLRLRSDELNFVPHVTDTYTCRKYEGDV